MATLAMTSDELREEVGYGLGYLRDKTKWTSTQKDNINTAIRDGIRRFVFNAVVPGTRKVYEWSFLRQEFLFSTVASVDTYKLPENFGSPIGPLIFNATNVAYEAAPIVNIAMVRAKQAALPSYKGVPTHAAIRSKVVSGAAEQREELLLYPVPDAVYPMRLAYNWEPGAIPETMVNLPGGAPHSRTILLACLAEGHRRILGQQDFEPEFQAALVGSVSYDSRLRGDSLGYNGDPGTERIEYQPTTRVTFNGVQY